MTKKLKTLYSVFDLLNHQWISNSPSMSNSCEHDYTYILIDLEPIIKDPSLLTKHHLTVMKEYLEDVNHCYYQPSELRPPVRINNCPYLEIVNKLMEEH